MLAKYRRYFQKNQIQVQYQQYNTNFCHTEIQTDQGPYLAKPNGLYKRNQKTGTWSLIPKL